MVVLDTRTLAPVATLADPVPARADGASPGESSTPASLALSADESRLYVAESDNNAVAVASVTIPMVTQTTVIQDVVVVVE